MRMGAGRQVEYGDFLQLSFEATLSGWSAENGMARMIVMLVAWISATRLKRRRSRWRRTAPIRCQPIGRSLEQDRVTRHNFPETPHESRGTRARVKLQRSRIEPALHGAARHHG